MRFREGLHLRGRLAGRRKLEIGPLRPAPAHSQIRVPRGWISAYSGEFNACLRSFPFRKELGRPSLLRSADVTSKAKGWSSLPGDLGSGRTDGPHRPIKRFRFESLNRRIRDDPPYQCAVARVMGEVILNTGVLPKAVNIAKEKE